MEIITTAWIVLSLALVFSIMLTPFSMHVARRLGAVDVPCDRSVHTVAVPRLGGIGIFLSLAVAVAFYLVPDRFSFGFLAGLLIIVLTGLIDDIKPLSHRFKFVGEIAAAAAFVGISGSELSGVGNILGFGDIVFGPFAFMATIFCMVGLINAMNLSDGLDGLAGGMAIIAALFFALLAYKAGQQNVMIIALALTGSLLGFLLYNGFPARLFMGDVGSLMIGYTCAVMAVQVVNASTASFAIQPITIALILAVPLLDTLVVMGIRIWKGMSPFRPDKTHLHHRLMDSGLSQNQAVSIMYALMFLYSSVALLALRMEAYWQFYGAILLTALIYRMIAACRENPWRLVSAVWALGASLEELEQRQHRYLLRVWGGLKKAMPVAVLLLLLVPLAFLPDGGGKVWLLPVAGVMMAWLLRNQNARIIAIMHGLIYLMILMLMFTYQTSLQSQGWQTYALVLASVSLFWVILGLLMGHMRKSLSMHSFEILLVLISWLVFFFILPMLNYAPTGGQDVRVICIYALPLLLMSKLCLVSVRRIPSFHREVGDDVLKQV